ncbi:MAG: hypothetical protein M1820_010596 [Bogoriella megaspora]|nr:MAG: hypothetical protein M1820_010596 [Bogoriella megaspora]
MLPNPDQNNERTPLLSSARDDRRLSALIQDEEASSILESHITKDELLLSGNPVGERLPYNDYTTIDWLHDLVKDSYRYRRVHSSRGIRDRLRYLFDASSGWIAVMIIGALTAGIAFLVDVAEANLSDWKFGYCAYDPFKTRDDCGRWTFWSNNYAVAFAIYVAWAILFGLVSASATTLTKSNLPAVTGSDEVKVNGIGPVPEPAAQGKSMYMAAGSGIPEIKTILSGFVIPHFLDLRVLVVKAFGAVFAVATGMCLGKEGPFVHISTCVGYLIAMMFPKYRDNGRKLREMLSAACASGLSVAFGAPIGGVLFSYEEISTYFPRKVLWRAFLCSLVAAVVLKALNPTGTGKLVLFETNYGTSYEAVHYLIFVLLGIAGGLFGGIFCRANYAWSKWFRSFDLIKRYSVFEVALVVLVTALLQYPHPVIREPGDKVIKDLLIDCRDGSAYGSWVCQNEQRQDGAWAYKAWLAYGLVVKLILTTITFGCKVPSGIIIPSLDAGALFGRLVGQLVTTISPGIFAMVGSAAFLAGVSRMTISLGVIMFELTGELEYIVPHMIAILVAKWVADALSREGVYDLAQSILNHPFLDIDHSMQLVQHHESALVEELIPPPQTMQEITVDMPTSNMVDRSILQMKLQQLERRGLMDAGLVLIQNEMLQGYLAQGELQFGLRELGKVYSENARVRLLGNPADLSDENLLEEIDLSSFVDRTPLTLCAKAPLEYAVSMFGQLGLRYLCITEEGTGRLIGVVIKKRLVDYLDRLKR